jgi:hypothetical protein
VGAKKNKEQIPWCTENWERVTGKFPSSRLDACSFLSKMAARGLLIGLLITRSSLLEERI